MVILDIQVHRTAADGRKSGRNSNKCATLAMERLRTWTLQQDRVDRIVGFNFFENATCFRLIAISLREGKICPRSRTYGRSTCVMHACKTHASIVLCTVSHREISLRSTRKSLLRVKEKLLTVGRRYNLADKIVVFAALTAIHVTKPGLLPIVKNATTGTYRRTF